MQPNQRRFSNACPRDEFSYAALCSQKYQSEERCTRPFNVARQAEPVARAGSLPACLNVTDDSEPSVWFSLEGLTENTSPSQCVSVHDVRQASLKLRLTAHVGD